MNSGGILGKITQTLVAERVHPTMVLNTLIELENDGGIPMIFELHYRLTRMVRNLREVQGPAQRIAQAWLDATIAYLETHAPKAQIGGA